MNEILFCTTVLYRWHTRTQEENEKKKVVNTNYTVYVCQLY